MSYEYDVFVSYRRQEPIKTWVSQYFVPELKKWLAAELGYERVFLDEENIGSGESFGPSLEYALRRSTLMVPVWAPGYFYSSWCIAELQTMIARERANGYRTQGDPRVLIAPIRFSDGNRFPRNIVGEIKHLDFYPYTYTAPGWNQTRLYVEFQDAVKELANRLAGMLNDAPEWNERLAIVSPGDVSSDVLELPPNVRTRL
jgi:hypothetical protein